MPLLVRVLVVAVLKPMALRTPMPLALLIPATPLPLPLALALALALPLVVTWATMAGRTCSHYFIEPISFHSIHTHTHIKRE